MQREGRLWLQKSGLPLQTMEEVRALFAVHSFCCPQPRQTNTQCALPPTSPGCVH